MKDIRVLFAAILVSEFTVSLDWYTRLLGREPDIQAHETEVLWRVSDTAWFYIKEEAGRAGVGEATFCVADLDANLTELESRGIRCGPVESVGPSRKSVLLDPDGNRINLIEVPEQSP